MAFYAPEEGPGRRGRHPENSSSNHYGIQSETHTLTDAVLWGPPGNETLLAQLYHPNISLFLDHMDVQGARAEAANYAELLREGYGVNVTLARDRLAFILEDRAHAAERTFDKDEIIMRSLALGDQIVRQFPQYNAQQQEAHALSPGWYKGLIPFFIEEDITRYGEKAALALNEVLSLTSIDHNGNIMPLGNSVYACDQMKFIGPTQIMSRMKHDIRRREVALYSLVYESLGINNFIELPDDDRYTFEGGDLYIHDNTVFIGVGARTSMPAALYIFSHVREYLRDQGMKFAMVVDIDRETRPENEKMNYMHLDTFSSPVSDKVIAECLEETEAHRTVVLLDPGNPELVPIETGMSYHEYLASTGNRTVIIPGNEQVTFGCNFLIPQKGVIIMPRHDNGLADQRLREAGGVLDYRVDLYQHTQGFGAAHCMTGQLRRSNQR